MSNLYKRGYNMKNLLMMSVAGLAIAGCQATANVDSSPRPQLRPEASKLLSNTDVEFQYGWDGTKMFDPQNSQFVTQNLWYHYRYVSGDYNNDGYTDYIVSGISKYYQRQGLLNNDGNNHTNDDTYRTTPLVFWGKSNGGLRYDTSEPFKRTDDKSGVVFPSITQADYDGDGYVDIFIGNTSWNWDGAPAVLYLNNGNGTWTDVSKTNLKSNDRQFAHQVESGDIDGDGDIDIVTTAKGYYIECWINNGSAVFKPNRCSKSRQESVSISLGDFDGDGDLDIYSGAEQEYKHAKLQGHNSAPETHRNRILVNNGRGSFSKGTVFKERNNCWVGNPYSEAFDVDGDGDIDIVNSITKTRYMFNGVEILENLGDGKSWKSKIIEVTNANDFPKRHSVWTITDDCVGQKYGKFSGFDETSPYNKHFQYINFGDVNGDGLKDIIVGTGDWFQNDEKVASKKIQGRVILNTNNTVQGFKLSGNVKLVK